MKRAFEDVLMAGIGGVIALMAWFAFGAPDQPPPEQPCVPLYHQTGLECCQ